MTRLEVLQEPNCDSAYAERGDLPAGVSYLDEVRHLFVVPSADRFSFRQDNLVDPAAARIREEVLRLPTPPPPDAAASASVPDPPPDVAATESVPSPSGGGRKKIKSKHAKRKGPLDEEGEEDDVVVVEKTVPASHAEGETASVPLVRKKTSRKAPSEDVETTTSDPSKRPKVTVSSHSSERSSPVDTAAFVSGFSVADIPGTTFESFMETVEKAGSTPTGKTPEGPVVQTPPPVTPLGEPTASSSLPLGTPSVIVSTAVPTSLPPSTSSLPPVAKVVTSFSTPHSSSSRVETTRGSTWSRDSPFLRTAFEDEIPESVNTVNRDLPTSDNQEDVYVPAWTVKVSDDTSDPEVCREIVDHLSPPVTSRRIQSMNDNDVADELAMCVAQAVAVTSECLHRWANRTHMVRSKREKIGVLSRRLEIREKDVARAEQQVGELLSLKNTAVETCRSFEKENVALHAENVRLAEALREATARPVVSAGEVIVSSSELDSLTKRAETAEGNLSVVQGDLLMKEEAWARERAELVERLDLANKEKENLALARDEIARDNNWLVRDGIKEFVGRLLGSTEFALLRAKWCNAAKGAGFAEGVREGFRTGRLKLPLDSISAYDVQASDKYDDLMLEENVPVFPYLEALSAQSGQSLDVIKGIHPKPPVE